MQKQNEIVKSPCTNDSQKVPLPKGMTAPVTIGFDIYGTLIDTRGVTSLLKTLLTVDVNEFSQTWRSKQLEYTFRRGLMQNYQPFAVCTREALDYTCSQFEQKLSGEQIAQLMRVYETLPAFKEVSTVMDQLAADEYFRLYAFSNGSPEELEKLLSHAGIRDTFRGIISCQDLRTFKPNPAVYSYFRRKSAALGNPAWLVSSNPFDVTGAISAGMNAAWMKRSEKAIFDPIGIQPTVTIRTLAELKSAIMKHEMKSIP